MRDPYQYLDYQQIRPEVWAALKDCAAESARDLRSATLLEFVKRLRFRRVRRSPDCASRPTANAQVC